MAKESKKQGPVILLTDVLILGSTALGIIITLMMYLLDQLHHDLESTNNDIRMIIQRSDERDKDFKEEWKALLNKFHDHDKELHKNKK